MVGRVQLKDGVHLLGDGEERGGQAREGEEVEKKGESPAYRWCHQHPEKAFFLYLILSGKSLTDSASKVLCPSI